MIKLRSLSFVFIILAAGAVIYAVLNLPADNESADATVDQPPATSVEVAQLATNTPAAPIQPSASPTASMTPTPTGSATAPVVAPIQASGQLNTNTPAATIPPSASPTVTSPAITNTPLPSPQADVPFGAIVDPNYTLAPTEVRPAATPIPTAVPTAGPSPTPGPGLISDLIGVQIHPNITDDDFYASLDHVKNLGVNWIKFQFNWSLLENGPGQYTDFFYMLRLYVQRAHNQNIHVMVSVAKAPGWARAATANGVMTEDAPPADPQTLANFISGMLGEIGYDVYGNPYVSAVEVWNEPNLQREWYGHPLTGGEYMRYFAPAYTAIRSFSPAITIITAAPAPTGTTGVSTNDRTWLQQLYNAGLASYGSDVVVGIHPYGWGNAPDARCCSNPSRGWDDQPQFFFLDTIEDYRTLMINNGHANAQMWGTEVGWATFDGLITDSGQRPADPAGQPFFSHINQWQQAEYLLRALTLAQERSYLGPMIIWNLNFATLPGEVNKSDQQTGYSLLDTFWQPRPVYNTLKNAQKR